MLWGMEASYEGLLIRESTVNKGKVCYADLSGYLLY